MAKPVFSLIGSTREYFHESLQDALLARKIQTYPSVTNYLVNVLEQYVLADNLFDEARESGKKNHETLAEMMLKASGATPKVRFELLKKLGDTALYVSGFFGDSLQRKVVDVDYYIDMGTTAYISLSDQVYEDTFAQVYKEMGQKFHAFVDVFSLMSRRTSTLDSSNVMRLMDVYAKTGSPLAQEQLVELGIFTNPDQVKKCKNQ